MLSVAARPLSGYMAWISRCNDGAAVKPSLVPWLVNSTSVIGYLEPRFAEELAQRSDVFQIRNVDPSLVNGSSIANQEVIQLHERLQGASTDVLNKEVAGLLKEMKEEGLIEGWRDELFPVISAFDAQPFCLMERAAVTYFGIKGYGIHVNGYVEGPEGIKLWVARRSANKPTWPGKLDHIVAGGQPYGLSCEDNVVKECEEEASVPEELARTAMPVGCVSYESMQPSGLKRDVLFCYDLRLPPSFVPTPLDGEVDSFQLMPIEEVAQLVRDTTEFKDNCNLVIIDFLIRHGIIKPDQPGYLSLVTGLRSGSCT
eukprot:jgi/Botrbrau1/18775/Bobra.0386s0093.1